VVVATSKTAAFDDTALLLLYAARSRWNSPSRALSRACPAPLLPSSPSP